jgi:hypothetical protein
MIDIFTKMVLVSRLTVTTGMRGLGDRSNVRGNFIVRGDGYDRNMAVMAATATDGGSQGR